MVSSREWSRCTPTEKRVPNYRPSAFCHRHARTARTSSAAAKSPRWLSPGRTISSTFGSRRDSTPCLLQRNERVWLAVPPPYGDGDIRQAEPPRPTEQDRVVHERMELALAAKNQIVDEHGLDVGVAEHPSIARGHHPGEPLRHDMGERGRGPDDSA